MSGTPSGGAENTGGSCQFGFGHRQQPVGIAWSQQVSDRVNCLDTVPYGVKYMHVSATLEKDGVPLAPTDSEECTTGGGLRDCVFVSAVAPERSPFCCTPSGVRMTNHGTWKVVLSDSLRWIELPRFCSGTRTKTATCERFGRYTSGNALELASEEVDDIAIARFEVADG